MTIQDIVREATVSDVGEVGEVGLSADDCLKCNVCTTVCPVARVTDLFPGPKYVGPQAQRFRLATVLPPQGPSTPAWSGSRDDDAGLSVRAASRPLAIATPSPHRSVR